MRFFLLRREHACPSFPPVFRPPSTRSRSSGLSPDHLQPPAFSPPRISKAPAEILFLFSRNRLSSFLCPSFLDPPWTFPRLIFLTMDGVRTGSPDQSFYLPMIHRNPTDRQPPLPPSAHHAVALRHGGFFPLESFLRARHVFYSPNSFFLLPPLLLIAGRQFLF